MCVKLAVDVGASEDSAISRSNKNEKEEKLKERRRARVQRELTVRRAH